jgi:hypothetical protein
MSEVTFRIASVYDAHPGFDVVLADEDKRVWRSFHFNRLEEATSGMAYWIVEGAVLPSWKDNECFKLYTRF